MAKCNGGSRNPQVLISNRGSALTQSCLKRSVLPSNRTVDFENGKTSQDSLYKSASVLSSRLSVCSKNGNQKLRCGNYCDMPRLLQFGKLIQFPMLAIELPVARIHACLAADLAQKGTTIGYHDLWIAATALSYGYAVMTTNPREFTRIQKLEVIPIDTT